MNTVKVQKLPNSARLWPKIGLIESPQLHGHKCDPKVTFETRDAIGERAQVILVQMRAPDAENIPPPT